MRINIKQLSCRCLNTNSLTQSIKKIYRTEGAKTFFNGWRYAVTQAMISNICYFSFYEHSKKYLQRNNTHKNDRVVVPLLASGFSRFLTTTSKNLNLKILVTFPLEYWRVL